MALSRTAKYYRDNPKARKVKAATDKKVNARPAQKKKRAESNAKRRKAKASGQDVKGKDYEVSHMDGRCIIEIRKAIDEPQQLYHAFLSYIRQAWEQLHRFPIQEEPPSLREVWIAALHTTPDSKIWLGSTHSNFLSSSSMSKVLDITAADYIDGKI